MKISFTSLSFRWLSSWLCLVMALWSDRQQGSSTSAGSQAVIFCQISGSWAYLGKTGRRAQVAGAQSVNYLATVAGGGSGLRGWFCLLLVAGVGKSRQGASRKWQMRCRCYKATVAGGGSEPIPGLVLLTTLGSSRKEQRGCGAQLVDALPLLGDSCVSLSRSMSVSVSSLCHCHRQCPCPCQVCVFVHVRVTVLVTSLSLSVSTSVSVSVSGRCLCLCRCQRRCHGLAC